MSRERAGFENLAFWVAPLASAVPLILFFGLPSSALFVGKLMGDPSHPFLRPQSGPWLAAMAVAFDATVLAYVMAIPVYLLLRAAGRMSPSHVPVVFALAGVAASQLVRATEHFRQPALHAFAASWLSPLFGTVCGLAAGLCFTVIAKRHLQRAS
jgi:hypothetical protein